METRSFAFQDGKSDKFWTITLDGTSYSVQFGRTGTTGQTQTKEFSSTAAARTAFDKLIAEKTKKGYVEESAGAAVKAVPIVEKKPAEKPPAPMTVTVAVENPIPPPPIAKKTPLNLSASELLFAPWRPRTIQERPPAPRPFNRDEALKKVEAFFDQYRVETNWTSTRVALSTSPEEANFWLWIMREMGVLLQTSPYNYSKSAKAKILKGPDDSSAFLSFADAKSTLNGLPLSPAIIGPLAQLYSWKQVCEFVRDFSIFDDKNYYYYSDSGDHSFRLHILPHLTADQIAELREAVEDWFRINAPTAVGLRARQLPIDLAPLCGAAQAIRDCLKRPVHGLSCQFVAGLDDPKEFAHEIRQRKIYLTSPEDVAAFLAQTELADLDWIAESAAQAYNKDLATKLTKAFAARVGAVEAAPVFLKLLDTKASAEARVWFEANPAAGLEGLESAGGRQTQTGRQLIEVLRRKLGLESAEENAAATGKARSLPVLTDLPDGLAQVFAAVRKKKAKPPKWISAADLPYIHIPDANGRLSDDDVNQLLSVLSTAPPRPPHPLLLALRCYADSDSLDTFSEALFNNWRMAGMSGKDKWALLAMGSLGSDRSALRIAPQVREWPGEAKHQAATWGLEVLRAIGTDTAIMQIDQIARKVKFQALKKTAQETMEAIADDRGLTRDELEDRIVADCGLDERGSRIFDFGPRQFKFRLGPNMKPVVIDGENIRRDDLPKPTSKDDPDLSQKAVADWKLLKKQVAEVVKAQVARMENALVTQRRWPAADFKNLVVAHPILGQIILPLIWGAYGENNQLIATFRVTEDRTFADSKDDTFELPEGAMIGLPHPAGLDGEGFQPWGEVLTDYALIPPFPQLSRSVNRLLPGEEDLHELKRFGDFELEPVVYAGIIKRLGYMHGEVGDGGSISNHAKWFPTSKLTAVIEISGMAIGFYDGMDPVSIEGVYFIPEAYGRGGWFDGSVTKVRLGDVDSVVMSEVLSDLRVLSTRAAQEEK